MSIHFKFCKYAAAFALITILIPLSSRAGEIGTPTTVNGFTFTNFDPSVMGLAGSNANGISNRGHVIVSAFNESGTFLNFAGRPSSSIALNTGTSTTAMAFGINSGGDVVGAHNGAAFFLPLHGTPQNLNVPAGMSSAFGINDEGSIVGQFTSPSGQIPGFYLRNSTSSKLVTINASSGPNVLFAQGINNFGLIVGFYVGNDGQDHGFIANAFKARNGVLTGTPIVDPVIPNVPGEPGATFVFSQLLGVNDAGIAVGYYGDSTTSQHGFVYDTNTGTYTFLDDPAEAFNNGVEVTQITGISNSGELTGFYTDANGIAHSFIACPAYAYCPK